MKIRATVTTILQDATGATVTLMPVAAADQGSQLGAGSLWAPAAKGHLGAITFARVQPAKVATLAIGDLIEISLSKVV